MELVQIASGDNGVYFDTSGRRLYTMGNYAPNVGEWVYTNGKTIYGHMTGGEVPAVINYVDDSVLPITMYGYTDGTYNSQQLGSINRNGEYEPFIKLKYGMDPLYGYVGNETHAYGCTRDYSSSNYNDRKWFDLLTGECLGTFPAEDACVGKDGELLTIEYQDGRKSCDLKYTGATAKIKGYSYSFDGKLSAHPGYDKICKTDKLNTLATVPGTYYDTYESSYSTKGDKDGYIRIRANGKVIIDISLNEYMDEIKGKVQKYVDMLNSGGGGGNPRPSVDGKQPPRPPAGVRNVSTRCSNLRVYPDRTYMAFLNISGSGAAYPYISVIGAPYMDATGVKKDGRYFGNLASQDTFSDTDEKIGYMFGMDGIDLNGDERPKYRHNVNRSINMETEPQSYSNWINASVSVTKMIGLGRVEGTFLNDENVGVSGSFLTSGIKFSYHGHYVTSDTLNPIIDSENYIPKMKPYSIPILPGFKFRAVELLLDENFTYAWSGYRAYYKNSESLGPMISLGGEMNYQGIGATAMMISAENLWGSHKRDYWENAFYEAGGVSYQRMEYEEHPVSAKYDICNGFTIKLTLYSSYYIDSVKSFAIYDGDKLVIDSASGEGQKLSSLTYYWAKMRAARLKGKDGKTRYLITNSCSYYTAYLVEDGKVTPLYNRISSVLETYSLIPFKKKKKLESAIMQWANKTNKGR